MIHLVIQQKKLSEGGQREEVSRSLIKRLYDAAHDENLIYNSSDLKGDLSVDITYQQFIDYLEDRYPQLDIQAGNTYIYFADPEVERVLATRYGDGIGLTPANLIGVSSIARALFENNTTITSFDELGSLTGITTILSNTFNGCSNLSSIDLSNIESIENAALDGTNIKIINVPNLTTISGSPFSTAVIEEIHIGANVPDNQKITSLPNSFCRDRPSLKEVTGLNMVTSIGSYAFRGSSIVSLPDLSSNLFSLGESAFNGCSKLKCIDITNVTTLTGNIKAQIFFGCKELIDLATNDSTQASTQAATYTFNWPDLPSNMFYQCKLTNKSFVFPNITAIGGGVFLESGIANINAPNVTSIGNMAFKSSNLETINIPLCTSIGDQAFQQCASLTEVTIGDITSIPGNCFYSCSNLAKFNFSGTLNTVQYNSNSGYMEVTLDAVTTIGGNAFWTSGLLFNTITLNQVTAPVHLIINNLTSLGSSAFRQSKIRALTLNFPLTSVGNELFQECTNLQYVDISTWTIIPQNMFRSCTSLTTIVLSNQLTSIGGSAFYNCNNLTGAFRIPATVTSIGSTVFANTGISCLIFEGSTPPSTLGSGGWPNIPVYVPNDAVSAYQTAFAAATNDNIKNNIHPISDYNPS